MGLQENCKLHRKEADLAHSPVDNCDLAWIGSMLARCAIGMANTAWMHPECWPNTLERLETVYLFICFCVSERILTMKVSAHLYF